jgi:glycosyltransferase involved in cell wall biosynthesis
VSSGRPARIDATASSAASESARASAAVGPERIDQVVPSFGRRDAIGTHVLHLRQVLRDAGYASDIWCRGAFDEVRAECHLLGELSPLARPRTWWLYHFATGSPEADLLARRPEPVMVDYHNFTPPELFGTWAPEAVGDAFLGRVQLTELAARTTFAMADSAFNEQDLLAVGYRRTVAVPPLFDPGAHEHAVDGTLLAERRRQRQGGGADWLFVGRVAPSKAQHDVVKAFACYRRWFDPDARLHLVGASVGHAYPRALERFARRLGLGEAVLLAGSVTDEELAAYYATADVFVCLSDHEGFCIPVVEAMHLGVPVVAFDAGAMGETVGTGGLVLGHKAPATVAVAVDRAVREPELRARLVSAGKRRAASFSFATTRRRWRAAIDEAVRAAPPAPHAAVPAARATATMPGAAARTPGARR